MDNIIYKMKIKIKRILFNLKNEETGAVLIIVSLLMVVFMILLALTLDIGTAYLSAGQLQKASDAAVYSAGRMLPVAQVDAEAVNAIKDSAINYAQLNGFSGLTRNDVVLGNIIKGNYTDIKVTSTMNVKMNFARVIGVNSINISRSAKSKLSPISKTTGVAPLGILESQLDARIASNDVTQVTHIVLKYGSGGSTQGFFGALDLDGRQGGGASDYSSWLADGYPGEIAVGDVLHKENGNMVQPTFNGSTARYNECTHFVGLGGCTFEHYDPSCPRVAKIVVYTINDDSNVKVTGFAAFVLEVPTDDGYIRGSFVKTLTAGQGSGGSAGESSDYGLYSLMLSE